MPVLLDPAHADGWGVRPVSGGHSGSHLVGSLALAEGYAVVPAATSEVHAGDVVDVMLLP